METATINMDFVRPATREDAIDGVVPRFIAEPTSSADVARMLKACNDQRLRVVARGGGTKIDWGNPPRDVDVVLSTRKLNQVVEHADCDLTATVQAGCTVLELANILARRNQRLALDPLWPDRATVGGIIATDDSGALRTAYGTLRNHLIGITVVVADGTIARSGGKVVKNVAGYDLPKLFTGSFGTLGVITEAVFRLYSIPKSVQTIRFNVADSEALGRLIVAMNELSLIILAVQFEIGSQDSIAISVQIGGLPEAMEVKRNRVVEAAIQCKAALQDQQADMWSARERLFSDPDACVAQIGLLPTKWPAFVDRMRDIVAKDDLNWNIVAQIVGTATMRLSTENPMVIKSIREEVEKTGGSLVLLCCPLEMKSKIDIWPDPGNALPLMRRIKEQFDPHGTLSPGRFIGGI